jgi:cation transport regulator
MPYGSIYELPPSVQNVLPKKAQEIFRSAFNSAWKEHLGEDEVVAFKIAWSAVKQSYEKDGEKWVKRKPRSH